MALKIKQAILNYKERTGVKITQCELAKKVGVNKATIIKLEKNPNKSIDTFVKIAKKLDCKLEDLTG